MQTTLVWQGIEYKSLEHCLVETNETGISVSASIVGLYEEQAYRVNYSIQTDLGWKTRVVRLEAFHKDQHLVVTYESEGFVKWLRNGQPAPECDGCYEVDIPVTPFTNTLPVNRLKMDVGQQEMIKVIYLDVLGNKFHVVNQLYKRISSTIYHYENVPNDFETAIEVDQDGFVKQYPELFTRAKRANSRFDI